MVAVRTRLGECALSSAAPGNTAGTGIFGGTFDPVHFGHLRAAIEVKEKLQLGDFRLLPAGTPALRAHTHASAEHRLAMLRLAVSDYPDLSVDDREVRRYVWDGSRLARETIYTRPDQRPIFTWNLMPVPVALIPEG